MSQASVLLFDIDGTLLSSSGAGRRAMEHALTAFTGREMTCDFSFDGMTDRAIVRRGLTAAGWPEPGLEVAMATVLDAYVARLPQELAGATGYRVYPGVTNLLEAARAARAVGVGLGTGNIRRGAALKLGHAGLNGYFDFGGFGCDHEERPMILRAGAERGAAHVGYPLASCRVVVIGDTPRDIAAAQAIGAVSVGIATGRYSCGELQSCGATHVFRDLTDPRIRDIIVAVC